MSNSNYIFPHILILQKLLVTRTQRNLCVFVIYFREVTKSNSDSVTLSKFVTFENSTELVALLLLPLQSACVQEMLEMSN
jgi:hypothetical protein